MKGQQKKERSFEAPRRDFPAIYASPTVETLDGSFVSGRQEYNSHQNEAYITPSRKIRAHPDDETPKTRLTYLQYTPVKTPNRNMMSPTNPAWSIPVRSTPRERRRKRKPRDFQYDEDALFVSVTTVDVAARTVFESIPPVSIEEWHRVAQAVEQQKKVSMRKRLSPSLQHLELLHRFQSIRTIRQLNFAPSTGLNADALYQDQRRYKNKRDGRYRSIDPIKATRDVLPETPPLLSNRKQRLPRRSDVGFPNATAQDMQLKQEEIRLETQWEEASPRLIVLITSDNFGSAVVDEGLPFLGKELLMADKRNEEHFNSNTDRREERIEADRHSVLAPPLGATYSSSLGWRPRPFYDRPPGILYGLASPLRINLDSGDGEPLVCSLALYSLGTSEGRAFGKVSEDYYFPAGDWTGKIAFDALRREDGQLDDRMVELWRRRKHKALFAYDPLLLCESDKSLHLVLQVYCVSSQMELVGSAKEDGTKNSSPATKKKGIGRRIKSKLSKLGAKTHAAKYDSSTEASEVILRVSSEDVFEKFGTQLLRPLSFGVVPFCPNHLYTKDEYSNGVYHQKMKWPSGSKQLMQLYSVPQIQDDQERFLERVTAIAEDERSKTSGISHVDEDVTYASLEAGSSDDRCEEANAARKALFKRKSVSRGLPSCKSGDKGSSLHVVGRASMFTSFLGADFTQSMLTEPAALGQEEESGLPRLLVDVSGDCAIAVDPTDVPILGDGLKRSDLIRLPMASIPSGYAGASEVRELMFLPPRFEKNYAVDPPTSIRSVQNLMYIYPRLLKFPAIDSGRGRARMETKTSFAVRVRLLRYGLSEKEETVVVSSFYNPAPWAGPPIGDAAYTKVAVSGYDKSSAVKDSVAFRDELKMRLPLIVDGTFHLQFSLAEIEMDDGDLDIHIVAETTVPLSSSSTREASSGVRVTTVIPNGCHRLKLGEYQLQFETRLLSSLHVADPTAATALRDFPFLMDPRDLEADIEKFQTLALIPSRSVIGMKGSTEPVIDLKIPFYQLFATASDSTLLGNFHLFTFMHLCNMVNHRKEGIYVSSFLSGVESEGDDLRFLVDNLQSLFELIRKVKLTIVSRSAADKAVDRIEAFVKDMIDSFDENLFDAAAFKETNSNKDKMDEPPKGPTALKLARSRSEQTPLEKASSTQDEHGDDEEENDGGAVHLRAKDSVRAQIDLRLANTLSKMNAAGNPLARVAYGATKTDRWRAEAEHYQEGSRFSHLVDDDETVVTALFPARESRMDEVPTIKSSATWGGMEEDDASVIDQPTELNKNQPNKGTSVSFVDTAIAKRVRSAAQVMIAPCIAPSVSKGVSSPGQTKYEAPKIALSQEHRQAVQKGLKSHEDVQKLDPFVLNGSDEEWDNDGLLDKVVFRGEESGLMVPFSYGRSNTSASKARVYAYEPIMALWVKAWIQHTNRDLSKDFVDFPILKLWSGDKSSPIYGFYAHMDVILPLCLKSMVIRVSPLLSRLPRRATVIFDTSHMEILYPLVGVLASSLLGEATSGQDKEESLSMALASSDTVLDFLVGIATILHPQQVAEIVENFIKVLRDGETSGLSMIPPAEFRWTEEAIHNVRCSRQLRVRAIERLSTLGPYLALNFPLKYAEWKPGSRPTKRTWTKQSKGHTSSTTPSVSSSKPKGPDRLPVSGWLSELLLSEGLLICSLSCEVFVSEAIANMEVSGIGGSGSPLASELHRRPGKSLTRDHLLLFQSIGMHAIKSVHELLIRRHAMDARFQTEQCRSRIASLVVHAVLEKSTTSVRWLARMESSHKIRSLWLVCFTYILQEAPETLLRSSFREYCDPSLDFSIHRIIRLLRLSSSTFQCLVDESSSTEGSLDAALQPWLLQESFNSICASIILLIDECTGLMNEYPQELKKMAQGTVDLLLHILTVPQSAVTHLRTVGGALQALEKFGGKLFLEVTGDTLQHWIRVMLTLMNSISLSVRSIAVDFVISLLGDSFARRGTIEDIAIVFATVLPEVVAREIALYSIAGLLEDLGQVEQVVWPLRRAWADIEDANPLDDDRVDPQLPPVLSDFCRSCQAIIDGVMIELRLSHPTLFIVGTEIALDDVVSRAFDADEESLFEAANYFTAEASPMQRLRWLNTLKLLHESKGQWIEAAETLMLSARTISDSLPHLRHVWMPSEFNLWNDTKRSRWLDTIGKDQGSPGKGNVEVMDFASGFLQPAVLLGETVKRTSSGKLIQPSVQAMCSKLMAASNQSITLYLNEEGNEDLAFSRLESLLRVVMVVVEEHSSMSTNHSYQLPLLARKRLAAEAAVLRKASASLNSDMTRLAEKLLFATEKETKHLESPSRFLSNRNADDILRIQYYVRVNLSGVKPKRFLESTSIPTYFEWDNPCICRVPQTVLRLAVGNKSQDSKSLADKICTEFGKPLCNALAYGSESEIVFRVGRQVDDATNANDSVTYLDVSMVHVDISSVDAPIGTVKPEALESKRFLYRKATNLPGVAPGLPYANGFTSRLVELTVARQFPCALSRQRTLITSEFLEGSV